MAAIFINQLTNETIIFNDNFENYLRALLEQNCHDDIRVKIARRFKLNTFVKKFNEFVYLPWKTAEQMAERNEITKDFLRVVTYKFGIKASRYISQFL